jgi:hypothetical protein
LTDSTEKRRRLLHHWQVTTPGVVAGTAFAADPSQYKNPHWPPEHLLSKAPFAELKHGLIYQAVPIVPEKLT